MTDFHEAFVDVSAFQRPDKWSARASNFVVWLTVLLLLTGGWFLKDWMMTQFRYLALAEDAPAIPYPVQWTPQPAPGLALQVFDPESQSAFTARQEVGVYPLPQGNIAIAWPEKRRELKDYHELNRSLVTLPDGREALVLTYTYVTDEEKDDAPPVVVKAQDVAFVINDGQADRLVVMTLAADVNEWDVVGPEFERILEHMGIPTVE
jgi:hypothetical protein